MEGEKTIGQLQRRHTGADGTTPLKGSDVRGQTALKTSNDTVAQPDEHVDQSRTILCGIANRLAKGIKRRFDELEALDHRVTPDKNEQAVILQEAKLLADAVVSAQSSVEEVKQEAPLRIDVAISGLE